MEKLGHLFKHSNRLNSYSNIWKDCKFFGSTSSSSSDETSYSILKTPGFTPYGRNLYKKLAKVGNPSPNASIIPILDQWVKEGRRIKSSDILNIVDHFLQSKRPKHCIQILTWTSDKKIVNCSPEDVSLQLELIYMIHGIKQAESHFNRLPNHLKVFQVHTSFLRCCVKARDLERAEIAMQKMRELEHSCSSSYNLMLTLYHKLCDRQKLDILVQEMKDKGISFDSYAYSIRLKSYLVFCDVEQIEMLVAEMEANPLVTMDWNIYALAASTYMKARAPEKAIETLKKSEHVVRGDKLFAYGIIIAIYANMGKREEVYRVWKLNKKEGKSYDKVYLLMIISLCKLEDLDGAEKILNEWEGQKGDFDHRIPRTLITAYCRKGLMEKAELIMNRLIKSGNVPNPQTWCLMATGYLRANQVDKAVKALKEEIHARKNPTKDVLNSASCLEYLERISVGKENVKSLWEKGLIARDVFEKLTIRLIRNDKEPFEVLRWKGMMMTWN